MNGHCLCGAVSFTSPNAEKLQPANVAFAVGGVGPLLAIHCRPNVQFSGTDQITSYASSVCVERVFCKRCGTHFYYKFSATGEYFVAADAVDSTDFDLVSQIYVDRKPAYYSFANQTAMLTDQQGIEQYTSPNNQAA